MMKVLIDYEASVEGKYRNAFFWYEDVTEKRLTKYLTLDHLPYHFCSPASECQIPFLPEIYDKKSSKFNFENLWRHKIWQ